MFKRSLFLTIIFIFYFLALLQTSFLVHFRILGIVPNLILALIIFWNIFEKEKNLFGLYMAVVGGFFLDIFSSRPIGLYILISLTLAALIKFVFKKYVRIPFCQQI